MNWRGEIEIRFYAELNDFLSADRRQVAFRHAFDGTPSVKDLIESLGVPHTEVDVILVDGKSVDFACRIRGGERVAVYPVFERFDVSPVTRLRPAPLRTTRFIADVHLGTLARYLRLLGFDTAWRRDLGDAEIVDRSLAEERIILTRDKGILRNGRVTHGYWLRATDPEAQLAEVVRVLDLAASMQPYTRCMQCNGPIARVDAGEIAQAAPAHALALHEEFSRCRDCGRIYWAGSHQPKLDAIVGRARRGAEGA